ncbi:MAG TPA: hypothetical protein VE401_09725 [Solirubrobacterales bacterium]|nr:hypothetical protein [Solirubrobacterales bacterium]
MEAGTRSRSNDWIAPLTGVVFVVLLAITLILAGEGVDPKDGVEEVLAYYSDNEGEVMASGFLGGFAVVFFLFFAGWLRKVLREAEGPGGVLSAVSFAGAIVFAVGGAVASTLAIALAESFDDIDPSALEAVNAIAYNYFIPFAVGFSTFLLATGISAVRHGALPGWLGWSAIVLGVATYTPAGFFAFLLGLAWVLVASVLLTMRARAG